MHYEAPADGTLAPQFVIEEIDRVTGGEALIVTDVGQHQMWSTLYYHYSFPRQWISSGGLGTMGFGLPAAIGAKLGRPDKTVIDVSGDGGFQMTMQELATAVNYDVPIVVAILNNGYLGMVRQWQDLFWNKRYAHLHRGAARFRPAGRGLRSQGPAGDRGRGGGRRPARGDRRRTADGDRLQGRPRGERVSDGAGRPGDQRDDRRQGDAPDAGEEAMKHTLSVLVENKPGVLTRVSGLFARRGFNIQSLAVGESEDPRLSRMTITIDGAEHPIDQVTKQLHKLINVVKIRDLDPGNTVTAELMLIKVAAEGDKRNDVLQIAEIFKAKIVDVERRSVVLRVVGAGDKLEALLEMLQPIGVLEVTRTGMIAMGGARLSDGAGIIGRRCGHARHRGAVALPDQLPRRRLRRRRRPRVHVRLQPRRHLERVVELRWRSACAPAYGIWRQVGPGRFEARYEFYPTRAPNVLDDLTAGGGWLAAGRGIFSETITVSDDGESFASAIRYEAFDRAGDPVGGGGAGTGQGVRLRF